MPHTVDADYTLQQSQLRPLMTALCGLPADAPVASWHWALARIPVPSLEDEDVLINVRAAALAKQDLSLLHFHINMAHHRFSVPENKAIHVPGLEVSGTIVAVGAKVPPDFSTGHEVMAICAAGGGCAELVSVSHRAVTRKPPALRHEQAVSIPYSGLAALQALELARPFLSETGSKVLVNSSMTGEGALLIQLARAKHNAFVVALMDDPVGQNVVRTLGADDVVDDASLPVKYPRCAFAVLFDCLGDAEKLSAYVRRGGIVISTLGPPTDEYIPKGPRVPKELTIRLLRERDKMTEISRTSGFTYSFVRPKPKCCNI